MKTNLLFKTILTLSILLFSTFIFAQDSDGDGVIDTTENVDGTDPADGCDFIMANVTVAPSSTWNTGDCDNDGVDNGTELLDGTDLLDACSYDYTHAFAANNTVGLDCDGDGVLDVTELNSGTNPHDACDYNVVGVTQTNTAGLDCDNDGVDDATELTNGTDPHDACSYLVADQANPNTNATGQDCDGDGVLDATELANGTDPHDPCSYNVMNVTVANTAGQDCDGDGVLDTTELTSGTDPHNACDYNVANVTVANTAGMDCDNDGVDDATELASGTDPHDACSYLVADQANPNTNTTGQDCDGDGVLDTTELTKGTDPFDACSYSVADVTVANTAGQDCDGDGVLDTTELTSGTDPHDACSYLVADQANPNTNTSGQDCDGDGVLDVTEIASGTDPHDACDFIMANQTITPTNICNSNTITGNIKFDYNNNGCDAGDFPLSNVLVTSTGSNTFTTFTDVNGNYIQNTNSGTFFTSATGFSSSYTATPGTQTTTFVGNGNTDNIDFCVAAATPVNDLNITVIPMNNPVPSNIVSYQIIYKNVGNTVANGSVSFNYDSAKLTYSSSSDTPDSTTSGNVTYNYTTLNPYEIRTITISFTVSSAAIGDILVFNSQIDPISGDATTYDNTISFAQIVSATLANRNTNTVSEINDVLVLEGNQVELANADEYLHYIIRFQNTTASSVANVIITNELSDKLDWSTLQLEKQSHNGQILIMNGNQVTFNFNGINLSNSATDEPNSHGYIAYRIKPISSIAVGDVISNQLNMYFDSNPVITTSSVSTTIINDTAGVNDDNMITEVNIYPNPSKGFVNINTTNTITKVTVYSKLGQLMASFKDLDTNIINLSSLSKGVYFLKLSNIKGNIVVKKVILE